MTPAPNFPRLPHRASARPSRRDGGWVLFATLILSSILVSVTVTYARHAVLAKKSLETAKGASEVEEASRSGLQRVRECMRNGDLPGTIANGDEDVVETISGEIVTSEREILGHDRRRLRVHAQATVDDDEADLRARAVVTPGPGSEVEGTRLTCEQATDLMSDPNFYVIGAGSEVTLSNANLNGFYVIEEGGHLILQHVVLHGAILTEAGLCDSHALKTGSNRPRVTVTGDVRILPAGALDDVAFVAPDLQLSGSSDARVDIDGMVVVDEIDLPGRGTLRGMVVARGNQSYGASVRRPGFGRGLQLWPEPVFAESEDVQRLSFPVEPLTDAVLDAMDSFELD